MDDNETSTEEESATLDDTNITIGDTDVCGSQTKHDSLKACPCNMSDPTSTYIKCAKCGQEWHNKCCNLAGISQAIIRKLTE